MFFRYLNLFFWLPQLLSARLSFPCPEGCGGSKDPHHEEIIAEFAKIIKTICAVPSEENIFCTKRDSRITYWKFHQHAIDSEVWSNPRLYFHTYTSNLANYHEFVRLWNWFDEDVIYDAKEAIRSLEESLRLNRKWLAQLDANTKQYNEQNTYVYKLQTELNFRVQKFHSDKELLRAGKPTIQELYRKMISYCATNHNFEGALYQTGLLYFEQGHADVVIAHLTPLIENILKDKWIYLCEVRKLKGQEFSGNPFDPTPLNEFLYELHQLKGRSHTELNQYNDAIISLTQAIDLKPELKEIYLERAAAYFETGDFKKSLEDFLHSESKITPIKNSQLDFASGMIDGIQLGLCEAMNNFIPSLIGSARGLSHGLWAFACDPKNVSKEMIDTVIVCISFVRQSPIKETLKILSPELGELTDNWDILSENKRGHLTGKVIGKYGIEIFASYGLIKGFKAFRNLSQANRTLTLEKFASDTTIAENITTTTKKYSECHFKTREMREQTVNQLKIWKQAQGDRLFTEAEIHKLLQQHGFNTFPRPAGIPENWIVEPAHGGGIIYTHPTNNHHSVRVMDANPFAIFSNQRRPYVKRIKHGQHMDKNGKRLDNGNCPEAHIPYEEFVFHE